MFVRDVMTSPARVVRAHVTVKDALRLLDELSVTALPVVDALDRIVGVVSEADLIRDAVNSDVRSQMTPVDASSHRHPAVVADVMTRSVVSIRRDDDLHRAVELMTSAKLKSLPVTNGTQVVGIISRRDVVHMLSRNDDVVQTEVAELLRLSEHDWAAQVDGGIVTLTGPCNHDDRQLAAALAYSVPGSIEVRFS
jgi:CBS domain-containing protein